MNIFYGNFNILTVLLRIVFAAIIGGLIGSERGRHGRAAGLRTHILVCVGASITSLTSLYLSNVLAYSVDIARLSAQVISGIGFLCAGTILIRNSSVITGLTTAAGIWATASIGIAVGYGFYVGAVAAAIICVFSVTILSRLERKRKDHLNIYVEITDIADTEQVIKTVKEHNNVLISYDIILPKSGHKDNVGITFLISGESNYQSIREKICQTTSVVIIASDINS